MDYESKIIAIEQALALVKSGDVIVTGLGASEAGVFMSQLHTVAARGVRDVMVTNCLPTHESKIYEEQYADIFRVDGWFYAPVLRKAHKNGNMAFIAKHLHRAARKRLDHILPNIYIGGATMPDKQCYVSLCLTNT